MLLLVPTAREARLLFDPGRLPRGEEPETVEVGGRAVRAALVGVGPAAAGALSALALAREQPRRCLLLGTCGTYDDLLLPVGGVLLARHACLADLGVEREGAWQGPRALGLEQAPPVPGRPAVLDWLDLAPWPGQPPGPAGACLTVSHASGSLGEAAARVGLVRERLDLPAGAVPLAEDMETFSVALAASRLGVACHVARAASNVAGEPRRAAWDLPGALAALRAWLLQAALG
ncbi:MAG: hypothetical protein ACKOSS_00415 [Planctomycetia bacterium]